MRWGETVVGMIRTVTVLAMALGLGATAIATDLKKHLEDKSDRTEMVDPGDPRNFVLPWGKGPGDFDVPFLARFVSLKGDLTPELRKLTDAESTKLLIGLNALRAVPPGSSQFPADWSAGRRKVLDALGEMRPELMRELSALYFLSISPAELDRAIELLSPAGTVDLRRNLNRLTDDHLPPPLNLAFVRDEITRVLNRLDALRPQSLPQYLNSLAKLTGKALEERFDQMTHLEARRLQDYFARPGVALSAADHSRLQSALDRLQPLSAQEGFSEFVSKASHPGADLEKMAAALNAHAHLRLRQRLHQLKEDEAKTDAGHEFSARIEAALNKVSPVTKVVHDEMLAKDNPRAFFDSHGKCALGAIEVGDHPSVEPYDKEALPSFVALTGTHAERIKAARDGLEEAQSEIEKLENLPKSGNKEWRERRKELIDTVLPRWLEKSYRFRVYHNMRVAEIKAEEKRQSVENSPFEIFNPIFHGKMPYFARDFLARSDADKQKFMRGLNSAQAEKLIWGIGAMLGEQQIPNNVTEPATHIGGHVVQVPWRPRFNPPLTKDYSGYLRRLRSVLTRDLHRRQYQDSPEGSFAKILAEANLRCMGENAADPPNLARLKMSLSNPKERVSADLLTASDRAFFWADNFYRSVQQQSVGHALTERLKELMKKGTGRSPEESKQVKWAEEEIEAFLKEERQKFREHQRKMAPKVIGEIPWLNGNYRDFVPQVVFNDDGASSVKFVPTEALRQLQLRQALARGARFGIGLVPMRDPNYDGYLHPIGPEAALLWYSRFGTRDPEELMSIETERGLRTDDTIPIVIAIAATGGLATPASAAHFGARALIRETFAISAKSVGNLAAVLAVETVGEAFGPGAALASIPLMMLGHWGAGRAISAVLPHAGNLARAAYHRVIYNAAERAAIRGGRTLGMTASEALAAAEKIGQANFLELARVTELALSRPGVLRELSHAGGISGSTIVNEVLSRNGLSHLGKAERLFLENVLRRYRTSGLGANIEFAFQQELLHGLGRSQAEVTLGRLLSSTEAAAVQRAHLAGHAQAVGKDGLNPPSIGNYSLGQLREKVEILMHAGFTRQEIRTLIERGIVGQHLNANHAAQAMAWQAAIQRLPTLPQGPHLAQLHQNISNAQRVNAIRDVPLADIISAPGHGYLRSPQAVLDMAEVIRKTSGAGMAAWADTPAVLNVTTRVENGVVRIVAVELLDGNHRIAAGIQSGVWRTIGDIPASFLRVQVNGHLPGGGGIPPRWIPLEVAQRSTLQGWQDVSSSPLARGPTAQIPGNISSFDPAFAAQDRGVTLGEVLRITLERIAAGG